MFPSFRWKFLYWPITIWGQWYITNCGDWSTTWHYSKWVLKQASTQRNNRCNSSYPSAKLLAPPQPWTFRVVQLIVEICLTKWEHWYQRSAMQQAKQMVLRITFMDYLKVELFSPSPSCDKISPHSDLLLYWMGRDQWVDEMKSGWVDRGMGRAMDEYVGEWKDGCVWMNGHIIGWECGWVDESSCWYLSIVVSLLYTIKHFEAQFMLLSYHFDKKSIVKFRSSICQ